MPTTQAAKHKFVADINALASNAVLMVTADYRGLTTVQLTDLRMRAYAGGVSLRVLKNTLAKRALQGTAYEQLSNELNGPLVAAFSHAEKEPGAAARVLRDYCKDHEIVTIKSVALPHEVLAPDDIDRLADLPTREQALAQLMSLLRAPVAQLTAVLQQLPGRLVRSLSAYADHRKESGQ